MAQVPVGNEAPKEGCLFENGWNICDFGAADYRQVYSQSKEILGPPVGSAGLNSQTFTHGKLVFDPAAPEGWKVQLANLGLEDLVKNGFTPQPGAELHPAVRDWISARMETGMDPTRVVGRMLSEPIPDPTTGQCRVWTDKTKLIFPCDATSGSLLQRAALGLDSLPASLPTPVPIVVAPPPEQAALPLGPGSIAVVLLIVGLLAALIRSQLSKSRFGNFTN